MAHWDGKEDNLGKEPLADVDDPADWQRHDCLTGVELGCAKPEAKNANATITTKMCQPKPPKSSMTDRVFA
jgi:hypothetical protein